MATWLAGILLRLRLGPSAKAHRALQAKRQGSAPVEDSLGTFTCDGNRWSTTGDVRITVYNVDREEVPAVLERHRAFVVATLADHAPLRLAAARPVVGPYNSKREDHPPLTAEQLAAELQLHSIRLPTEAAHGPFLIFRFGDQSIQLALDADYEPRPAG